MFASGTPVVGFVSWFVFGDGVECVDMYQNSQFINSSGQTLNSFPPTSAISAGRSSGRVEAFLWSVGFLL